MILYIVVIKNKMHKVVVGQAYLITWNGLLAERKIGKMGKNEIAQIQLKQKNKSIRVGGGRRGATETSVSRQDRYMDG